MSLSEPCLCICMCVSAYLSYYTDVSSLQCYEGSVYENRGRIFDSLCNR